MDAAANQLLHARAAAEYEQSRFSGRSLRDGDDMVARPTGDNTTTARLNARGARRISP
jgi:hypothetical protein